MRLWPRRPDLVYRSAYDAVVDERDAALTTVQLLQPSSLNRALAQAYESLDRSRRELADLHAQRNLERADYDLQLARLGAENARLTATLRIREEQLAQAEGHPVQPLTESGDTGGPTSRASGGPVAAGRDLYQHLAAGAAAWSPL